MWIIPTVTIHLHSGIFATQNLRLLITHDELTAEEIIIECHILKHMNLDMDVLADLQGPTFHVRHCPEVLKPLRISRKLGILYCV